MKNKIRLTAFGVVVILFIGNLVYQQNEKQRELEIHAVFLCAGLASIT
jgi:hypothetical protein